MKSHTDFTTELLHFDWRTHPHTATGKGIRDYDDLLPSANARAQQEEMEALLTFRREAGKRLREGHFADADQRLDLELAEQYAARMLAERDYQKPWRRNPAHGVQVLAMAIGNLMSADGRAEEADQALLARLHAATPFLVDAAETLRPAEVPPLWLDLALSSARGLRLMLTRSLPAFAADRPKGAAIVTAAEAAVAGLDRYTDFLGGIRSSCAGDYASGPEYFEVMLRDFYKVEMGVGELHRFGLERISEFESALIFQARAIDPDKHWTELIEASKQDHPSAAELIAAYAEEKDRAAAFVRSHGLVTIPEGEECLMQETPLYARPTTPLGSMQTVRAYGESLRSYFNITPVDLDAPVARQEQHLRDNNYAFIRSIAFHEVIPGHHLQACWHRLQPGYFRRNFGNTIFIEGWGLYTEDLMAETGYLAEPIHNLIRLKNALWRAVRVVVDVGLHTQGMPFGEAVELLEKKIRQGNHMALGEASRYTVGPTYPSSYMVGRNQILLLRDECRARWGDAFSLRRFHDELLSYGSLPVALIRREMLSR